MRSIFARPPAARSRCRWFRTACVAGTLLLGASALSACGGNGAVHGDSYGYGSRYYQLGRD
jgi:hypothetical protein